jgi:hypothetical protein
MIRTQRAQAKALHWTCPDRFKDFLMTNMPPDETDAEQRHRLWRGIRHTGPVQWLSFCIVLAMVVGLAWLAIHYLERASF